MLKLKALARKTKLVYQTVLPRKSRQTLKFCISFIRHTHIKQITQPVSAGNELFKRHFAIYTQTNSMGLAIRRAQGSMSNTN